MKPSLQQQYYKSLWKSRGIAIGTDERSRLREILKSVNLYIKKCPASPTRPLSILDLGCGTGWLGEYLLPYGTVHAGDFESETISRAASTFPDIHYHVLRDDLPLYGLQEQSFDIVISTEVIEHVKDKTAFLRTINRILKTGGCLILTTPRGELYIQWHSRIKGETQPVEEWLTANELSNLITDNGFSLFYRKFFYYMRLGDTFFERFLSWHIFDLLRQTSLFNMLWRLSTDKRGIYQINAAIKMSDSHNHVFNQVSEALMIQRG